MYLFTDRLVTKKKAHVKFHLFVHAATVPFAKVLAWQNHPGIMSQAHFYSSVARHLIWTDEYLWRAPWVIYLVALPQILRVHSQRGEWSFYQHCMNIYIQKVTEISIQDKKTSHLHHYLPRLLVVGLDLTGFFPPEKKLVIISDMSGMFGFWLSTFICCCISFRVSGSAAFIIFGSTMIRSRGSTMVSTIGLKRKSVMRHCSLCWK